MGDAMEIKEEFKKFVKDNPSLVKYVRDGKKTWQDFFEIYSLYGSDNSVWKEYIDVSSIDFFSFLKTIDVDSIQSGISSIQRVLGVFQDLVNKDDSTEEYQPRPVYKHFED
jgi:hypothetical protein